MGLSRPSERELFYFPFASPCLRDNAPLLQQRQGPNAPARTCPAPEELALELVRRMKLLHRVRGARVGCAVGGFGLGVVVSYRNGKGRDVCRRRHAGDL